MYRRAEVVLEFLDSAPVPLRMTVTASRPPDEVFAAFAHDPATWDEFFPGIVTSGCYHTPVPHGVGSGYVKRFLGVTIEERVLAWDEGKRFTSRGERTSVPVFHAWVEGYRFEPYGHNGTVIPVAMGAHPRMPTPLARLVLPLALPAVCKRTGRSDPPAIRRSGC